ncbi:MULTISPECIES: ABC transporter ATP-binding protein [Dyadobacter]|uniref:ABC transporter ATP-binding protein YxlF n=1 Tax=Dyadobacter helix TaxID=2822344 RepID=A0A916JDF5_9BACT|nr:MULTISPECIES: ABC transporter ATP-binding protein [unclassified Dyadobacter]OJV22511.1 MAG: copper ABC transporter ATP-binding protein [Dyadobacter sp. 50-39]CAG5001342.1 putative ABC transporter ATP-binding protein YxlF [Dyadobacter sp. CECT 9275]
MISIQNISKQFGKFKVLNNVSFDCGQGQCIALIGPNGSGKTTIIKSILGMVHPDTGSISFEGKDIASDWLYRNHIGYMPQIGRYPENMSIGQVLDMMKDIRKLPDSQIDHELFEAFNIRALLDKRMGTLSGGTRQKVSACLAFMFSSKALILDEPSAGLDPVSSEILREKILAEKKKNKLIIITSHILSELDELITEAVYMQDGSLRFHNSIQQLQKQTGEGKLARAIAAMIRQQDLQAAKGHTAILTAVK